MTGKKWTENETMLLWTELTNKEICEQTGRTMDAVRTKRFNVTGHYTTPSETKRRKYIHVTPVNNALIDKQTKVNRIIAMANKLGVRIKGVR